MLIAQTIAQLRADARQDDAILGTLQTALNGAQRPEWLDEIKISEIALGEEFPIFSNCRIIPVEDGISTISDGFLGVPGQGGRRAVRVGEATRLQARIDVDLSDVITLGVDTKLVLNYPKPRSAVLPVALSVSIVRFSGTLSLSFVPSVSPTNTPSPSATTPSPTPSPTPTTQSHSSPQSHYHPPTSLTFTFLPDYRLDLSVRSLVGSRARLTDVPKIAQLVEDRIHAWFDERVVEPRFQQIVLPSLWPRKKTARGPEADDEAEEDEAAVATGGESGDEEPLRYASDDDSLEARLERDGRRLREDERRKRGHGHGVAALPGQVQSKKQHQSQQQHSEPEGLRRRAYQEANRSSEGLRMMPGGLPPWID